MKTLLTILLMLPLKASRVESIPQKETKAWEVIVERTEWQGIIRIQDNRGFSQLYDSGTVVTMIITKTIQ